MPNIKFGKGEKILESGLDKSPFRLNKYLGHFLSSNWSPKRLRKCNKLKTSYYTSKSITILEA